MRSNLWAPAVVLALLAASWTAILVDAQTPAAADTPRLLASGDHAAYDLSLVGDWPYDGRAEGVPGAGPRFKLGAPEPWVAADGARLDALPVTWHSERYHVGADGHPRWEPLVETRWLAPQMQASQRIIDERHDDVLGTQRHVQATTTYTDAPDCLLDGPGRGAALRCRIHDLGLLVQGPLRQLGIASVHGMPAQHIRLEGEVRLDWWLTDLPIPLRFEMHAPERTARWDLTGFAPGDGAGVIDSRIAAPTPWLAPTQDWLIDDRGIDHPFPLSRAFQAAMTTPDWPHLRVWMHDHDGYVFMADHAMHTRDGTTQHIWRIHLSDGDDGFSLRAALHERPNDLLERALGDDLRFQVISRDPAAASAPSRDALPAEMLHVSSLFERWQHHAELDSQPSAWGFRVQEADGVQVRLAAGHVARIDWGAGLDLPVLRSQHDRSLLLLDGDGRAIQYQHVQDTDANGPVARAEMAPVQGYATTAAMGADHLVPLGVWASLVAAFALAWPLAKHAGLALFSRLAPHELVDHPVRHRIMDALRNESGLHMSALASRLGEPVGRIRHHVRKLVQGGVLVERIAPGYTCFYPAQGTSRAVVAAGPITRSHGARQVIGAIAAHPGSTARGLAQAAGLSPATTSYHLKRLQQAGLVCAERDGRCVRVSLTQGGSDAAASMGIC